MKYSRIRSGSVSAFQTSARGARISTVARAVVSDIVVLLLLAVVRAYPPAGTGMPTWPQDGSDRAGRQVVDGHATDGRGREVRRDPRRDRARRARAAARATGPAAAATTDEVV